MRACRKGIIALVTPVAVAAFLAAFTFNRTVTAQTGPAASPVTPERSVLTVPNAQFLSLQVENLQERGSLFIAPADELGLRAVWINRMHETSDLPRAAELPDLSKLPETLDDLVSD